MKKALRILLAVTLAVTALCACGKKAPEIKYELDAANPLPADSGAKVTEQTFAELSLSVGLPSGFTAEVKEEEDAYGTPHPLLYVTKEGASWQAVLEPTLPEMHLIGNTVHNLNSIENYYENYSTVESTFQGMKANYFAKCIREGSLGATSKAYPSYDIVVDYGNTAVGRYIGLRVTLSSDQQVNIYELINEKDAAAFLNHIKIIEGDPGQTLTAGGITVTVPSAWTGSTESSLGPVAGFPSNYEIAGSVSVTSEYGGNPKTQAEKKGETSTMTFGGKEYISVKSIGEQYSYLYLYSEFNDERSLCVTLQMVTPDEAKVDEFAAGDTFKSIVESIEFNPDGYFDAATKDRDGDWIVGKNGELVEYTGSDAAIEIPDTLSGRPVTVISAEIFKDNKTITSVVIPEGVTTIMASAFENCTNLESVTLPSTLEVIHQNVFRGCPKLEDVVIGENIQEIGDYAFYESGTGSFTAEGGAVYGMHSLEHTGFESISVGANSDLSAESIFAATKAKEVTIGEGSTGLGKGAFTAAVNVYELVLPDSIKTIGENGLSGMSGLRKLTLPNALERLDDFAMSGTDPFMIILPETVTYVGPSGACASMIYLMNGNGAELGDDSLVCDYLYMNGIYDTANITFNFNACNVSIQNYLPADATLSESDGLDAYLAGLGWRTIAWIGPDPEHFDPDFEDYAQDSNDLIDYTGDKKEVYIPTTGASYGTGNEFSIWHIGDGALANKGIEKVSFGELSRYGSRILAGNDGLTDIWFTGALAGYDGSIFVADTFAGVPETVTVHLPESLTEEQRGAIRGYLEGAGMPAAATYEYYSFR